MIGRVLIEAIKRTTSSVNAFCNGCWLDKLEYDGCTYTNRTQTEKSCRLDMLDYINQRSQSRTIVIGTSKV